MSIIHISDEGSYSDDYAAPICGRGDWSSLTTDPYRNECLDCRLIDGTIGEDEPRPYAS